MMRVALTGLFVAVSLIVQALMPPTAGASDWIEAVDDAVRALQIRRACFGGSQPQTLHILGITRRDLVDEATQIEILTDLNARLSQSTGLRVTRADTFQYIATSSAEVGGERQRELQDLLARTDRGDITLVLRPFRATRGWLDVEVMLWARNAGGDREITCTPSLAVSISRSDPECAALFRSALDSGNVEMLRAFAQFRPDCPQAATVEERIRAIREQEAQVACQADFNRAVGENTVEAFDRFLGAHPDCALRTSAQALRDQLASQQRQRRTCADAYDIARSANTAAAYEQFASRYATCPEARLASELARTQREQEEADRARQVDAARQAEEERLLEERQRAAEQRAAEERAAELRAAAEEARRRAAEEEARRQALLRQPSPQQWQPQRTICYVHDVRPPDAWLALRTEPSTRSGRRLRKLPSGTPLEMLGQQSGNWHRVRIPDGTVGWVSWQVARWIRC